MFERPQSGEKAILVHVVFSHFDEHPSLSELQLLAQSAGAEVLDVLMAKRDVPDSKYFIGSGKCDELKSLKETHQAELLIVNHALSPAQTRNLERALECRVLDRTGLILDIFAQRAKTHEGKLQVELAQLQYLSTRLVRGWTHLERQKGGIGLRGPGETQLETDRRLLRNRIVMIKKRLEKVRAQRDLSRQKRQKHAMLTVSLVGYTNAGKSTLFNALTHGEVYVQDQLFATLDPTLKQCRVPGLGTVVLVDTVGFIRNLPHDLVDAFRATLEETVQADLLLHVVDAHSDEKEALIEQVDEVLKQVEATHQPILMVYNKIDLLEHMQPRIDVGEGNQPARVWLSAQQSQGLDLLRQAIADILQDQMLHTTLCIPAAQGELYARLHQEHAVINVIHHDNGDIQMEITIQPAKLEQICRGLSIQNWRLYRVN